MLTRRFTLAALFVSAGLAVAWPAPAADFHVENAVYIEGNARPQSQGVTIFHDGLVYDFLTDPSEIIVFDKAHRRFELLDLTRRVRSEVSLDDVKAVVERAKQRLAGHSNPQFRWLGAPSFDEALDRDKSALTMRSDSLTYEVQLLPAGPDVAVQYREFSDWYAQFNYVLNPGSRPPFARMKLNDALERNQGIAKEVRLTANFTANEPPQRITSRHELAGQLDSSDTKRLADARDAMQSFRHVSLKEYMQKK